MNHAEMLANIRLYGSGRTIGLDENGKVPSYTDYGCYPIEYVTKSNVFVCPDCVNNPEKFDENDPVVLADIYYEGPAQECEDCGKMMESAYGDPDAEDEE